MIARSHWAAVFLLMATAFPPLSLDASAAETLQQAWSIALAADYGVQAGRDRVQAAACNQSAARAAYWPSVTHRTSVSLLTDSPSFSFAGFGGAIVDQDFVTSATVARLPLYTGGRISSSVSAARSQLDAARRDVHRSQLDLKLEVATAYTIILRAIHEVQIAKANEQSLAGHEKVVGAMLARGQVPENDLLAARVAWADARQQQIQAENVLAVARATYNRLLNRPLDVPVEIDDLEVEPLSGNLDGLTELAIDTRPELPGLAAEAAALRHRAASVRAATRPQFGVEGGFMYLESPSIHPDGLGALTFNLEWKPIDGGAARAKANALLHQAAAVSKLRADMVGDIALEVRRAWLDERVARRRIEVARQALSQAEDNLATAKVRFRNGVAINTEVLDAESLRTRSYGNYYNAVYDSVLTTFRVRRAVGIL